MLFRFLIVALIALVSGEGVMHAQILAHTTGFEHHLVEFLFGGSNALMASTLGTGALTLTDWAKRLDPDGKVPKIVEILAQKNGMLDDMRWIEGNLPTGHRSTIRTGLPTVYWRLLNQGVAPSKSTTTQVDEQTGMLEAWSEVDKDLAMLNGNTSSFRLSEAKAFLEAMNQEVAQTLIYGNVGLAPEEFTGLAPRYSAISGATNADNIVDGLGTGSDNTSIWLVAWNEETVHGIFPKGTKAGILHDDYGETTVEVTAGIAGNRMRALQERYQWKAGLVVKDWRYVVRICNIDVSDLTGGSPADLIALMEQADEIIPDELGQRVFYVNRRVSRYLRKQVRTNVTSGGGLTFENYAGKRIMMFDDVPIRKVDAILNTEARVV